MIVPMLGRPHLAQRVADSLARSLVTHDARLLFVVNSPDTDLRRACAATGADVRGIRGHRRPGDYARKINAGAANSREPWIFTGASDLLFHQGWLDEAMAVSEGFDVIGTNDLGNRYVMSGRASTHTLVHRRYLPHAVIDDPGKLYSEAYDHNYCDQELVGYARAKGRFRFARRALVEHMHPHWMKAEMDATYAVSAEHFRDDQRLYIRRSRLWHRRGASTNIRMEQRRRIQEDRLR